jgi:hypothetical protein
VKQKNEKRRGKEITENEFRSTERVGEKMTVVIRRMMTNNRARRRGRSGRRMREMGWEDKRQRREQEAWVEQKNDGGRAGGNRSRTRRGGEQ